MNFSSIYNSLDAILKVLQGVEVTKKIFFKWQEWGITESFDTAASNGPLVPVWKIGGMIVVMGRES